MWRIDELELKAYLDEIWSCDAFELHRTEKTGGKQDFYIPYMMNDALECYLVLTNGTMTGTFRPECKEEGSVELVSTEQGPAAIFRQGSENVFTIWYEDSFCEQVCYRYDQIGHFWVEGEEHWRRLVYIVGTIYDKYRYMGEDVCNEKELALMPLMEFGPFRWYTPLHESLDAYYEDSPEGLDCMKVLAEEAEDLDFLQKLKLYELSPFKQQARKTLIKAMQNPKRNRLYEHIFKKVQEASSEYPERTYSDGLHEMIQKKRAEVQGKMISDGYTGTYPLFFKGNRQVLVLEEHPFTISELEYENYGFKIQYMISEVDDVKKEYLLNAGFFAGKGRRGWIEKEGS